MTPRQLQLLDFIKAYTAEKRMAPTFREMQDHMGLKSPSNTYVMVQTLERDGYVLRDDKRRGVKLTDKGVAM